MFLALLSRASVYIVAMAAGTKCMGECISMMTRMAHQCRDISLISVDSLVLGRRPLWMRFAA